MTLTERFLKYVAIDTASNPESTTYPSTEKQFDLLNILVEELSEMGISDVEIDKYGYVTACIPANTDKKVPTLAFIAHVDTSPEVSGKDVKAKIIDYKGGDIELNTDVKIPQSKLKNYINHKLIVTDGTTLLGADDKAGVAEIMTVLEYFLTHKDIPHGQIKVLFTPDEEIGSGVDYLDINKLDADYAYTVDGGECGSLEWETFNAAEAIVTFKGINYHPGYAKDVMINSQLLANEFMNLVPKNERPENTQDREGFYHLTNINGNVEQTTLHYIIRDHDKAKFEQRKQKMLDLANKFTCEQINIEIKDQYYNMGEVIKDHYITVEVAEQAMISLGIEPKITAVRGGTDGSRLSFMGLPCPNIFSGAENIHSRLEFVSEDVMCLSVQTVIKIIEIFYQKSLEN